jgi:hypothetical protein
VYALKARKSILFVTDILFLCRIKGKIADRCNQGVDSASNITQNDISPGSGRITLGLERGMVDDQAADPTQEKGQKKANEIVVVHFMSLQVVKYKCTIQLTPTEKARIFTVYHNYNLF